MSGSACVGVLATWTPRALVWAYQPGSAIELLAGVGALFVLGQLVFGGLGFSVALSELGTLGVIGIGLPKILRSAATTPGRSCGSRSHLGVPTKGADRNAEVLRYPC